MNIEIIGAVDGLEHYTPSQIAPLLTTPPTELSYGAAFMGRPSTRLHVGETAIIKLRTELDLNAERGRDFLLHTLQQEQKLKVHHPHKTWFLLQQPDGKFKMGNICPRLTPLHTLEAHSAEAITQKMAYLEKIYRHYFQVASQFAVRLDEGLSNFGIDDQQHLYYLDDDLYAWDNFVSFSHLLGILIRSNPWLDEARAVVLGGQLQQFIDDSFADRHTAVMVAGKLSDIYMPDKARQRVLEIIIAQLQQQKVIRKQIQPHPHGQMAILSDIHANLPALQVVLSYLQKHGITQGMVLGDIVGYGPHPGECIDCLRETELVVIKGNHDHAVATGDNLCGMSKMAKWCIDWTIPRLTTAQRQWLSDLPLELHGADDHGKKWQAVHGAPIDPNYFYAYVYQMTYEENLAILAERGIDWCFHGHSHIQGLYVRDQLGLESFVKPSKTLSLTPYQHALICSGAVGQPRDGCLGAQFAIYNQHTHQLQFMQLDYAIDKTVAAMQVAGFPDTLWQRLQRGT
jgi:predicted phosphodiesterase